MPQKKTKTCRTCKIKKPTFDFYRMKNGKYGVDSICKECQKKAVIGYQKQNPEKFKAWNKKAVQKRNKSGMAKQSYIEYNNSKKGKIRNKKHLAKKYGLTIDEYNNMFIRQQGCCAICGTHFTGLAKGLSVDHNHITGNVRGLLCHKCNIAIGCLYSDEKGAELLEQAVEYLRKHND